MIHFLSFTACGVITEKPGGFLLFFFQDFKDISAQCRCHRKPNSRKNLTNLIDLVHWTFGTESRTTRAGTEEMTPILMRSSVKHSDCYVLSCLFNINESNVANNCSICTSLDQTSFVNILKGINIVMVCNLSNSLKSAISIISR